MPGRGRANAFRPVAHLGSTELGRHDRIAPDPRAPPDGDKLEGPLRSYQARGGYTSAVGQLRRFTLYGIKPGGLSMCFPADDPELEPGTNLLISS